MITSRHNERLKDFRRVRRCRDDRALLEGPHLVLEALATGLELGPVLATQRFVEGDGGRDVVASLPRPPLLVEPRLLDEMADSDSPRGLLTTVTLPRPPVTQLPRVDDGLYVFVDGLQDPGNLGALARVAEAAGATALALGPGCAHPNHPRALRASAGSLLRIPVARSVDPEELQGHLADLSPRWLALEPRQGDDLYTAELAGTVVLLLGAEGPGLSPAAQGMATERVTIPMAQGVESLNATVAAALVLFEWRRRRLSRPART